MKPADKKAFFALILSVGEMFDKGLTEPTLQLFWESLEDLGLSQVRHGVAKHLRDPKRGQFMPKPADIRRYSTGASDRDPVHAWSEVERAMTRLGAYATVQFEDSVINLIIRDMGGWPWICSRDIDEPWTQKEFERRYEAYRDSGQGSNEPLMGLHEQANRASGYLSHIPAPVLIGPAGDITLPQLGGAKGAPLPGTEDHRQEIEALVGTIAKLEPRE